MRCGFYIKSPAPLKDSRGIAGGKGSPGLSPGVLPTPACIHPSIHSSFPPQPASIRLSIHPSHPSLHSSIQSSFAPQPASIHLSFHPSFPPQPASIHPSHSSLNPCTPDPEGCSGPLGQARWRPATLGWHSGVPPSLLHMMSNGKAALQWS